MDEKLLDYVRDVYQALYDDLDMSRSRDSVAATLTLAYATMLLVRSSDDM
jgi:hypothetical protein